MQQITIDIDAQGNVTVEGTGIQGPDCVKLTEEIENALGEVKSREKKAEFHRPRQVLRKAGA